MIWNYFERVAKAVTVYSDRIWGYDHLFGWIFVASAVAVAALVTLVAAPSLKSFRRRLLAHLGSQRARRELSIDSKYFCFVILYEPLLFILFGFSAVTLSEVVSSDLKGALSSFLSSPLLIFEPSWGQTYKVIATLLIWDFSAYVHHRLNHEVSWMWLFHKTHHRPRYLTPLAKWRIHPLDSLSQYAVQGVIAGSLLGLFASVNFIPPGRSMVDAVILSAVLFRLLGHLRHSHVWVSYPRWLSHVLISPAMHQIHHSTKAAHIGKNYGVVFSLWDGLFGSLYIPVKKERLRVGIDGDPSLGVLQDAMQPFREIAARYAEPEAAKVESNAKGI